jgi:hypothetical protein
MSLLVFEVHTFVRVSCLGQKEVGLGEGKALVGREEI